MGGKFTISLRSQELCRDSGGHNYWRMTNVPIVIGAENSALLLCDVWDRHWSRGANERVNAMIPRMSEVVATARAAGIQIVHAPSDTMAFYKDFPARKRVVAAPQIEPPPDIERPDPPLPVDASDDGSDTDGDQQRCAWIRQHPGIEILDEDAISDNGREVYSLLAGKGIGNLLIMGVHTNMCVLGRSFAIKQMVRWGMKVVLVRDLTDTMYNPARSPYVNHAEGTRLVVEYIEKFWCPTTTSEDLLRALRAHDVA